MHTSVEERSTHVTILDIVFWTPFPTIHKAVHATNMMRVH